jgi:hypothetical protein
VSDAEREAALTRARQQTYVRDTAGAVVFADHHGL